MRVELYFYTTAGCHLCEQAELLLNQLPSLLEDSMQIEVIEIDISTQESLVTQYGIRIPVVRNALSEKEVGWQFSTEDLITLF